MSPDPADSPRLVPEDPSARLRVALGSSCLIDMGSIGLSLLGHLGLRSSLHTAERLWARAAARTLRLRLDLEGLDRVDPAQSYVVIPLHEGLADVVALFHLPLPLRFLVRDELDGWRGVGRYLRATGQIEVAEDRNTGSLRQLYMGARTCLARGESLVVFAQGTILGLEVAFQSGAFRLAGILNAPLLPVVLTGSHRVWEHPYSPLVRLGQRMFMRVLPPIGADKIRNLEFREVEREMKRIALEEATAPPRRFDPDRDGWWDDYRYEIDPDFPELKDRVGRHRAEKGSTPRIPDFAGTEPRTQGARLR
ncbi:MAG TPA: lysophospholipid acyltransferase family protein [Acidimicrobiia bacterium]|nr:lysophospholipid acyltransferase family protein [Acidimicrobiia bacterium]